MTKPLDESWDWSKASPVDVEVTASRPLRFTDLLPLLEELNDHYTIVRASHRRIEPPMHEGVDVALMITVIGGIAAAEIVKGFFAELGKDAYASVRRILLDLMKEGRQSDRGRLYVPLAVRTVPWTFYFRGDDDGVLSEKDILEQLRNAHESVQEPLSTLPDGSGMGFDPEEVEWHAPSRSCLRNGSHRSKDLRDPVSPPSK